MELGRFVHDSGRFSIKMGRIMEEEIALYVLLQFDNQNDCPIVHVRVWLRIVTANNDQDDSQCVFVTPLCLIVYCADICRFCSCFGLRAIICVFI